MAYAPPIPGLDRFGGSSDVIVLPSQIPNLAMWFKADAITGKVDGDTVSTWSDSSGNGNTATGAGTPLYKTNVLNGLPSVRYNGVSLHATGTVFDSTWDTAFTVVALVQSDGAGFGYASSEGTNKFYALHIGGLKNGGYNFGAAGDAAPLNAMNLGAPIVDVLRYDGVNKKVRHQGQNMENTPSSTPMGLSSVFNLGFGVSYYSGDIFELMVFKRALTDAEVLQVEAYLRDKWNVLNKPRLVFVGDSIYAASSVTVTYNPPVLAVGNVTGAVYAYDATSLSRGGTGMADYGNTFAAYIDACVSEDVETTVVIQLILNDLFNAVSGATAWANMKAWCLARKAAGVNRILIHTCTPSTNVAGALVADQATFDAQRVIYNNLVLAHYLECADGVVNIAGNSIIGDPTDSDDTNYYQSDKIHPNDAGTAVMAGVISNALLATLPVALALGGTSPQRNTPYQLVKYVQNIADATATTVLTVTIPNAVVNATLRVTLLGSLGAGGAIGAGEASGTVTYDIAITRTAGVAVAKTIATAFGSAMTAVVGAATMTLTAVLTSGTVTVGTVNTFLLQPTITKSGGSSANHTCLVKAELLNATANLVTLS